MLDSTAALGLPASLDEPGFSAHRMANEEIELKLSLRPEHVQRLQRSGLVRQLAKARSKRQHYVSTYFDTPNMLLRQHGMALRVRHDGQRHVQTLKAPKPETADAGNGAQDGNAGLQDLLEYETEIEGNQPELGAISDQDLQKFFRDQKVASNLEPVFTTDFDRRALPLSMSDSEIELAIDTGRIIAGTGETPLCEAELELLNGRPSRLFELAMMLLEKVPFRLEGRSKAQRGYALYQGQTTGPQKARRPELRRDDNLSTAFAKMFRAGLDHMRANELVVMRGDDPEGVHQMRVAIRRLRALVAAFRDHLHPDFRKLAADELKWMQQELGPARDWDVFIAETLDPLINRLPGDEGLPALREEARALRDGAYQKAAAAVGDKRYTGLLLRMELWLDAGDYLPGKNHDGAVKDFAVAILEKRHKKVRKWGRDHDKLTEAQYHKLRIQVKKLRYAADFFGSLFPEKRLRPYLKRLSAMQDRLGSLNDAVTGQQLLDQLHRSLQRRDATRDGPAVATLGVVLGWQAACIERDLESFPGYWKKFTKTGRFWRKA